MRIALVAVIGLVALVGGASSAAAGPVPPPCVGACPLPPNEVPTVPANPTAPRPPCLDGNCPEPCPPPEGPILTSECQPVVDPPPAELPPPVSLGATGPSPAWIATDLGSEWLASDPGGAVPEIVLFPGDTVQFHLGFRPGSLVLVVAGRSFVLQPEQNPVRRLPFRAHGRLLAELVATHAGQTARYLARFLIPRVPRDT